MKVKKLHRHSLSFWLKLVLTTLFAVFAVFLLAFFRQSLTNMFAQETANREAILELTVENVNSSLEALESYLYQEFSDQTEVVRIETGGTETQVFYAKQELFRKMEKIVGWNASLRFLFFYSPTSEDKTFLRVASDSGSYSRNIEIQEQVQAYIDGQLEEQNYLQNGYLLLQVNGTGYLIRFYRIRSSYFGMCLAGDSVLELLEELTSPGECLAFLCDVDGNVVSATDDFTSFIDVEESGVLLTDGGIRYLQLCYLSGNEDFYIGTWTTVETLNRQFADNVHLLIGFAAGAVVLIAFMTWLMQRFLYAPVVEMERGMKQVREGEWDLVIRKDFNISEYDYMIHNFNEMVSEIRDLKIRNYEKEIAVQKTYLQYLQLQVNPHFYLNALNIIYSAAQVGNCVLIQTLTMSLVEYSRYMFREPGSLVTVQQEMEHVENYMKIQKIRFPNRLEFDPSMSTEIEEALIPPFIIQSFAENSIKYAVSFEQRNVLSIRGNLTEIDGELFVEIEIRDNGTGYSQEVLQLIGAKEEPATKNGERVGIRNVRKRLELVFGDRAKLILSNDNGAVTRILIPFLWQDEGDEAGEPV